MMRKVQASTLAALWMSLLFAPHGMTQERGVAELMQLLQGSYRTADPEALDENDNLLWDRRQLVELESMGEKGIYWQLNSGKDDRLYRQRLLTFVENDDGSITQITRTLDKPEKYTDQFHNTALWAGLTSSQLQPALPDGCDQVWRWTGENWQGLVDPRRCRLWSKRREQWRRIGAEVRLFEGELWQVERGYDDAMNQLFGTAPGEYHVLRRIAKMP